MIQFNLLPSVKIEYIKSRRTKRLVTFFASSVAIVMLAIMLNVLLYVNVIQKNHISNLNHQIQNNTQSLQNTSNLSTDLTMSTQVKAIPTLYNADPVVARLFTFVSEMTPTQATISTLTADFQANTLTISGNAPDLATVNQFVDTIETATYQLSGSSQSNNAFSSVVLSSFGYATGSGASYTITADITPAIFSNSNSISSLSIPSFIPTRSGQGSMTLFKQQAGSSEAAQGN